jgi:hypothetical protein
MTPKEVLGLIVRIAGFGFILALLVIIALSHLMPGRPAYNSGWDCQQVPRGAADDLCMRRTK